MTPVTLTALLRTQLVRPGLAAAGAEEVLRSLARLLTDAGYTRPSYEDAVVERERVFPTGLQFEDIAVAIPHADPEHVLSAAIAIATLQRPVSFADMGDPAHLLEVEAVFMLAIPAGEQIVVVLRQLVDVFQQPGVLRRVQAAGDPEAVITLLRQAASAGAPTDAAGEGAAR